MIFLNKINKEKEIYKIFILLLISLLYLIIIFNQKQYYSSPDFGSWGSDWSRLKKCMELQIFPCTQLSKFPFAYLLNSLFVTYMASFGLSPEKSLSIINMLFAGLPIFFYFYVRGLNFGIKATLIYAASLMTSAVLPFYLVAGALEFQSGILLGIFLSCLLLLLNQNLKLKVNRIIIAMSVSGVLFPFYKDTTVVVVVLSTILTGIIGRKLIHYADIYEKIMSKENIKVITILLLLALTSLLLILLFNYSKSGSILPVSYIIEASLTKPSALKSVEFFIAKVFSPNGGILIFWVASFTIFFILSKLLLMSINILSVYLTIIFIVLSTIIFALWWAPFGWDSWGNRLIVPTMVASLICLISNLQYSDIHIANKLSVQNNYKQANKFFNFRNILIIIFLIAFVIVLAKSLNYTYISNFSNKDKIIQNSLFSTGECQKMQVLLSDGTYNKIGWPFWRTETYYDCARSRFLYAPKLTN